MKHVVTFHKDLTDKAVKKEFEIAVVNEPSVLEPLKFYCIEHETQVIYSVFPTFFMQENVITLSNIIRVKINITKQIKMMSCKSMQ